MLFLKLLLNLSTADEFGRRQVNTEMATVAAVTTRAHIVVEVDGRTLTRYVQVESYN